MISGPLQSIEITLPGKKSNMELNWPGKRPFTGMPYQTARCTEAYGNAQSGWMNRIYLGDNLCVMGNLLGEFRGAIDLIYIDPPFNSGVNYRKKIKLKDRSCDFFMETQFTDTREQGAYLQFMYERLVLMRELLADTGSIYLHCDWHACHHLRMLMDEVFGPENFRNEIAWCYLVNKGHFKNKYPPRHDTILFYAKTPANYFNGEAVRMKPSAATLKRWGACANENGEVQYAKLTPGMKKVAGKGKKPYVLRGGIQVDWISSVPGINSGNSCECNGYPTQKPEKLINTFVEASTKPGDLVFDCFMGSGSAMAAAMKLGRRFIGADINPGAVSTTTGRLLSIAKTPGAHTGNELMYTGFGIFTCIDTEAPRSAAEADIAITDKRLIIRNFTPGKLMQKPNKQAAGTHDWRSLAETVMMDFDYNGEIFRPTLIDIPGKNEAVKGVYEIPRNAGTIRARITDVFSESLEFEIRDISTIDQPHKKLSQKELDKAMIFNYCKIHNADVI